jgi:hypothetical protein
MVEIADVAAAVEKAWDKCLPGRAASERNSVLRELQRLLAAPQQPLPVLRLCYTNPQLRRRD